MFSMVIGFVIRINYLFQRDFWFDEAFTFFVADLPVKQLLLAVLTDNNPPFYYILMHVLTRISRSAEILRLPSLLFNLGSAYFLYRIVIKLVDKRTALYTVTFFSLSPLSIYLATTARLHSLGLFFIPCIFWFFLRLVEKPTRMRKLIFLFFSVIGLYTHYYIALIFVPISIIIYLKYAKFSQKSWLLLLAILMVSFLPWAAIHAFHQPAVCACPPTHLALAATMVSPILGGMGEVTVRKYSELPLSTVIFFGTVVIINLFLFGKGLYKNIFLKVLFLVPLVLISIAGIIGPFFSPKGFSIYSSTLLIIYLAMGISRFKHANWLALLNTLLLLVVNLLQMSNPFFSGTSIRYVIDTIKLDPFRPIVHISAITYYPTRFYLPQSKQMLLTEDPFSEQFTNNNRGAKIKELIPKEFWLVDTANWVDPVERNIQIEDINQFYVSISEVSANQVSIKQMNRK